MKKICWTVYRWSGTCSWILMPVHGCRCCFLFMDGSFCSWMKLVLFINEYDWKFLFINKQVFVHGQGNGLSFEAFFLSMNNSHSWMVNFYSWTKKFSFINGNFSFIDGLASALFLYRWSSFRSWKVSSCLWMRTFSFINGKFSFIDGAHFVHEW